jgi:hypothetical protein
MNRVHIFSLTLIDQADHFAPPARKAEPQLARGIAQLRLLALGPAAGG